MIRVQLPSSTAALRAEIVEVVAPKAEAPNGEWEDRLDADMDPCLDRTTGSRPSPDVYNDPCLSNEPRVDSGLCCWT